MTRGTSDRPANDADLRRRLLFQSRHRGTKELDLILGPFAERYLAGFGSQELRQYAELLAEPDPDIYAWLVGTLPPPARLDHPVMRLLLAFKIVDRRL